MPIAFSITAISGTYPYVVINYYEKSFLDLIGIFYPSGELLFMGGVDWRGVGWP
jgi:hypothetical protein